MGVLQNCQLNATMAAESMVMMEVPPTPRQGHVRETWRVNPLLQKTQLGNVKTTTYALPSNDHVYGKALQREEEGAGEVIMSWNEHQPNPDKMPGRDFAALNKASVSQGATDPRAQRDFRKTHDIRLKLGTDRMSQGPPKLPSSSQPEWAYGRPTRPSTPLGDLVSHSFRWDWVTTKEMEGSTDPVQGSRIAPQATKASMGHARMAGASMGPPHVASQKELFKMKKFKQVPAKLQTRGQKKVEGDAIDQFMQKEAQAAAPVAG